MQFKSILAVSALAATAFAAPENQEVEKRQLDPANFASSFVGALLTAAPEVIFSVATLPSASATAAIESALYGASSGFPTWYSALPTDIQSYLSVNDPRKLGTTVIPSVSAAIPTITPAASTPGLPVNGSIISSAASNITSSLSSKLSSASAALSSASSKASSASAAASSASKSATASSSTSTGGAAMPTAIVGSGIMGAIALFGVLAL